LKSISISIFHLAWGLYVTRFSFVLLASTSTRESAIKNGTKNPGLCLRLDLGIIWILCFDGNPLIECFFEKKYEMKIPAWSENTTVGQAGPSDCHKTAKIIPDEDNF
jgi:hypothetical protein